jgi:PAS domain-containing protein
VPVRLPPLHDADPTAPDRPIREPRAVRDRRERRLLSAAAGTPALVLGPRTDVVAWNAAATAVFGATRGAGAPNLARRLFLDPGARTRYPDRAPLAAAVVARLHRECRERPHDARLAVLVAQLREADPDIARLWDRPPPAHRPSGSLLVRHPVVGVLSFYYQVVALPGTTRRTAVTATPLHGTATVGRLRRLLAGAGAG